MLELRAQYTRMQLNERLAKAKAQRDHAPNGIRIHLRPTRQDGRQRA